MRTAIISYRLFHMKYFNVCTQLAYTDKDGQEKKRYYQAGILKLTPTGMMYLRLFTQPSVEFFVFEQKDLDEQNLPAIQVEEPREKE